MGPEAEPEGWRPRASSPWRRWLTKLWRWLSQPVDFRRPMEALWRWVWPAEFWRVMEVLGLWAAAGVGLHAITVSSRDAREQVTAIRDQLDEMQQEGRPWIGPTSSTALDNDRGEPLRVSIAYRNFGRRPATFVRNAGGWSWLGINPPGARTEDLSGWKDPKVFNPRALCETSSPHTTVYPGDGTLNIEEGASKDSQIKDESGQNVSFQTLLDGITHKKSVYVVYGCFTYFAGGQPEFTTFCLMLDPTINNNNNLSTWKLAFCPYGNDNGKLPEDDANHSHADN
jgi:hypothetical protein